jgi:hypothetical protein
MMVLDCQVKGFVGKLKPRRETLRGNNSAYYKTDNYDAGNKSLEITLTSEVLGAGANVILNPMGRAAAQSAITIGSEIAEDKLIKKE